MQTINLEASQLTPRVFFSASGNLLLEGKSMPEDVAALYMPMIEWLENYVATPAAATIFDIKLSYFNTASSKYLLDLLLKLQHLQESKGGVTVNWHYDVEDESMEEAGEAYQSIVHVPFYMVPVEA